MLHIFVLLYQNGVWFGFVACSYISSVENHIGSFSVAFDVLNVCLTSTQHTRFLSCVENAASVAIAIVLGNLDGYLELWITSCPVYSKKSYKGVCFVFRLLSSNADLDFTSPTFSMLTVSPHSNYYHWMNDTLSY
jgi:hypothetical protein